MKLQRKVLTSFEQSILAYSYFVIVQDVATDIKEGGHKNVRIFFKRFYTDKTWLKFRIPLKIQEQQTVYFSFHTWKVSHCRNANFMEGMAWFILIF